MGITNKYDIRCVRTCLSYTNLLSHREMMITNGFLMVLVSVQCFWTNSELNFCYMFVFGILSRNFGVIFFFALPDVGCGYRYESFVVDLCQSICCSGLNNVGFPTM